jgi:hypothetical protein
MPDRGISIWRGDGSVSVYVQGGFLYEFLSSPKNHGGQWFIDGGWGGPPGPVRVTWDNDHWRYDGFPPHDD